MATKRKHKTTTRNTENPKAVLRALNAANKRIEKLTKANKFLRARLKRIKLESETPAPPVAPPPTEPVAHEFSPVTVEAPAPAQEPVPPAEPTAP